MFVLFSELLTAIKVFCFAKLGTFAQLLPVEQIEKDLLGYLAWEYEMNTSDKNDGVKLAIVDDWLDENLSQYEVVFEGLVLKPNIQEEKVLDCINCQHSMLYDRIVICAAKSVQVGMENAITARGECKHEIRPMCETCPFAGTAPLDGLVCLRTGERVKQKGKYNAFYYDACPVRRKS